MSKSDNKKSRKPRSDKFPLTLHTTGQYCKKICGKIHYFGVDKRLALQRYLEQASMLHSGKTEPIVANNKSVSLKYLSNLYLEHQHLRAAIGQIKIRHISDQKILLKDFAKFVGSNTLLSSLTTFNVQNYISRLIKNKRSANTINNRIAVIKSLFNWAIENEIIERGPNLKAVKKITKVKTEKPTFSTEQIHILLGHADIQMKAMILLGLNCGFGCTDCAELKWENMDLKNLRVVFPRGKTGISRNLSLWPETVAALKDVPKQGELVFYTVRGNSWVRTIHSKDKSGNEKFTKDDAVSKAFSKLLKKVAIKTEKGVGFYTLRRTAATLAARSGDPFSVQRLLGHADLKMASVYVQDVSEQTDRVINNTRKLIIPDDSSPSADSVTDTAATISEAEV
jgi:integrase